MKKIVLSESTLRRAEQRGTHKLTAKVMKAIEAYLATPPTGQKTLRLSPTKFLNT